MVAGKWSNFEKRVGGIVGFNNTFVTGLPGKVDKLTHSKAVVISSRASASPTVSRSRKKKLEGRRVRRGSVAFGVPSGFN